MKKILSLILVVALLSGLYIHSSAALAPHAIISSSINHFVTDTKFTVNVSVRIPDVLDVDYLQIYMNCNKDVIKCNDNGVITPPSDACVFEVEETQTGYLFRFSLNEDAITDVYICYALYDFEVVGTGEPQISFTGETKMVDEVPVESVLSVDMPVDRVFVREELPQIQIFNKYCAFFRDGVLYLNEAVSRDEILRNVSSSHKKYPVELTKHYENEQVMTGDLLYISFYDRVSDEIPICLMGDVNCDGKVSAADARLVLRHSANLTFLDGYAFFAADVDCDTGISAADARLILRASAQIDKISIPPIEMKVGDVVEIGPLKNAGSGLYNWSCTVFDGNGSADADGLSVSMTSRYPEDEELVPGTPVNQIFALTAENKGKYTLSFALSEPWSQFSERTIDMFSIDIIVFNQ